SPLREQILRTLLDILRRSLAVKVDALDTQKQLDLVEQTKPRLLEGTVWYIEDPRELVKSVVAYPRAKRGNDRREDRTGPSGGSSRDQKREVAVLTSGTGSGKSLTYIVPIVDHVLRRGAFHVEATAATSALYAYRLRAAPPRARAPPRTIA